jgi:hypothetical protein
MNWISIRIELTGTPEEQINTELALNTIGYEMRPNKCRSVCWGKITNGDINWHGIPKYRFGKSSSSNDFYYELLVPGIKDRSIRILDDLGYKTKVLKNFSKKNRRAYYKKVTKPKKR